MNAAIVVGLALAGAVAAQRTPVESVEVRKNITYYAGEDADKYRHRLDLYLPAGRKDVPVLIFVHGGGWRTGIKEQYAQIGDAFAARGIATAVINYRLSPKVEHPGHVRDVARAFAWARQHIAEYGGRPDAIFLSGHSSGGHLVALLGSDPRYLQEAGASFGDVKGVIPISGPFVVSARAGLFGPEAALHPDLVRAASPLAHVAGGHPPFLILYGDGDAGSTRDDAEKMAAALKSGGTRAEAREIAPRNHMQMVLELVRPDDPGARAIVEFITGR
jgi:acetyl esterase/lipase